MWTVLFLGNQGSTDCIFSDHFDTRTKFDVPNSLNYVPSIEANNPDTIKESNTAMVCLKCVSCHAKLQEEQRKQLKRDTMALCETTKQKEISLH